MKVIFLDFDGVVTIPDSHWKLNPDNIKLVKKIVDETNAKIVVSSSWRHGLDRHFEYELERNPDNEMVIWLRDNVYDITPLGGNRGSEIKKWLDTHDDIENYVILDDDSDMLNYQLYHFVETNFEDGLTETEAIRAIKVLNKLFIQNPISLNFTLRYEWQKKCEGLPNSFDNINKKYNDLEQNFKKRYDRQLPKNV